MDVLAILTLILAVIGGIAAIVQILDYIEKKRLSKKAIVTDNSPAPIQAASISSVPVIQNLYGRSNEIEQIIAWASKQSTRLIGIFGIGGVGKTSLTALVVRNIANNFDFVLWYSVVNAPPVEDFLREVISSISNQSAVKLPETLDQKISVLLDLLYTHRFLIVIDNLETLLKIGVQAGYFREDFEGYGVVLQRLSEVEHRSCVIITSREKPRTLMLLNYGNMQEKAVRYIVLSGLSTPSSKQLLDNIGLKGSEEEIGKLNKLYTGNPLALKLISDYISTLFSGNVQKFLKEGELTMGDVEVLIEEQFKRLSELERRVLNWLAIERTVVNIETLRQNLLGFETGDNILNSLVSLQRRHLVEKSEEIRGANFFLQPVILEFITDKLIREIVLEFQTAKYDAYILYSLFKAQAEDYVRESQKRMILSPLVNNLLNEFGIEVLKKRCFELLSNSPYAPGLEVVW